MKRQTLQAAEKGLPHPTGRRAFGERGRRRVKDEDGNLKSVPVVSEARAARERELIREAASRILAGDSLRGIVTDWNARGIAAADGGQWRNSPLRRVLLSPRVAGYREYHGKLYPGDPTRLPPILDDQTWEAVRTILTDLSRRTSVGGGQPPHLLTGLLRCGICDRPLRGRMVRKTKSESYRVC
jgi:site-specific DNA recombinase